MRQRVIGGVCLSIGLLAASAVTAAAETVVFPEGSPATDVANVRAAVAAGGVVLLKAVNADGVPTPFEFSTMAAGLSTDVTILGERIEGRMTTIRGGFFPFTFLQPVRAVIRGIHFDAPRGGAVLVNLSRGLEFAGNVVTDVVGVPSSGGIKGQAVFIDEARPGPGITGTIAIVDNHVERVIADLSYGVSMLRSSAATRIANNTFVGTTDTGILVINNTQPVWIEDNTIVPGAQAFPGFFSFGNGVFLGQGSGAFYVRRNRVICENPFADGIALSGLAFPGKAPASSVVEANDVTMNGSLFGGLTIYGQIDPSLFARNRVRGDGAFAILFTSFLGNEQASGVVFQANNLSGFQSTVTDVIFDVVARNTVLAGDSGTVVDLGVDNRITGMTRMGAAIGPELEAALTRKRELLRNLQSTVAQ